MIGFTPAQQRAVVADWEELCRWDPTVPPGDPPPPAGALVAALSEAIGRPQPLGWGADPAIEQAAEAFGGRCPTPSAVVAYLVCLREAAWRRLEPELPPGQRVEALARLATLVERAIGLAVATVTRRLENQAFTDPLTGLLNRRALERDLSHETARSRRHGHRYALVVIDTDGLKLVNDTQGHAAGDALLSRLAREFALRLRAGDNVYRIGGDEFALLLPETTASGADALVGRVSGVGVPAFSWGVACYPDDGTQPAELLAIADHRLYDGRAARRSTPGPAPAG